MNLQTALAEAKRTGKGISPVGSFVTLDWNKDGTLSYSIPGSPIPQQFKSSMYFLHCHAWAERREWRLRQF